MLASFACKDPCFKSSKRRNHLKPDNLETPFLLSVLKMPFESVTKSPLIFRFCNCIFMFQHSNVFLFFNAGNKIFCFFKKWVLLFWTRVHLKGGGSQVLQNFEALLIKVGGGGGGGLTDLELFLGGLVKRGEVNISGWGWYPGGHYGKVKLIRTDFCRRWCKLDFELSHGSGERQDKICKQQVCFSCCLTLLTTAVSHEVKSSYYRC